MKFLFYIVDPSLDLCPLGTPMSDNTGRHMSCVTSSNCPTDSKCVKSTVEGVEIGKCCLDESKCSSKCSLSFKRLSLNCLIYNNYNSNSSSCSTSSNSSSNSSCSSSSSKYIHKQLRVKTIITIATTIKK